jgi:hypothetical protein
MSVRVPSRRFHARAHLVLSLIDWVSRPIQRERTEGELLWIVATCAIVPGLAIAALVIGTVLT